jgi:uncharacterized protein (TIGR02996 family)
MYLANPGRHTGVGWGMPSPTGDELALLKAVVSAPDDDLPRLVYADWLDEHGRPERAEFIRLQVAALSADTWAARRDCKTAADYLLDQHREGWFRELPRWVRMWYTTRWCERPDYCRGFVEEVAVLASHFLRFGGQLLDRTPVAKLDLFHLRGVRTNLARCPWLGRVPHLNLAVERLAEEGAAALAGNPHLGGVRTLDLYRCELGDAGVRALAEAESLTGLTTLDLGDNGLTLAAVKALRGAPFLRTLTWLNLANNTQLIGYEDRVRGWLGERVRFGE